jgi:phosphoserine phosphatase RsbU/P
MSTPLRVLIVEDMEDDCNLLLMELRKGGFSPSYVRVQTEEKMREALKDSWELIISDFALPNFSGPAALAIFKESGIDIPFIIVSGTVGEDIAVATMRAGANDYIIKNQMTRLVPAIQRELVAARARGKNRNVEQMLKETEAQLLHAQKMEAVGRLAGGIRRLNHRLNQ